MYSVLEAAIALRDVNQATVDLVKQYEGIPDGNPATDNIDPYLDPVGIWTIGWGHAITYQGRFLKGAADKAQVQSLYPGGITLAQAEALLHTDLMNAGRDVSSVVLVSLNDNEFGALTSFTFNLGIGNLRSSTLLKMLNANNRAGAADQFGRWVMADGKPLPGLVKRRAAERDLFLTPVVSPADPLVPPAPPAPPAQAA
jgi:lysozyme